MRHYTNKNLHIVRFSVTQPWLSAKQREERNSRWKCDRNNRFKAWQTKNSYRGVVAQMIPIRSFVHRFLIYFCLPERVAITLNDAVWRSWLRKVKFGNEGWRKAENIYLYQWDEQCSQRVKSFEGLGQIGNRVVRSSLDGGWASILRNNSSP